MALRPPQLASLASALDRLAPSLSAADIARDAALLRRLAEAVTVQETAVLRNREELEAIDWARLAADARPVRVWAAGCATGEEAYTLAILALEALSDPAAVSVLGTDLSAGALERARRGRLRPRSLTGADAALRDRYFEPAAEGWAVRGEIGQLVRFRQHNLARDPIPPPGEEPFDVVVCRNVLIYLDELLVEQVVRSLRAATREGGVLVLGAVDALHGAARELARVTGPAEQA